MFNITVFQSDLLRLVAGLAAGWSFVMTVAILVSFFRRVGFGFGWHTIDDRKRTHILLVSMSFTVLSAYAIYEVYTRVGEVITWRSPTLFFAFLLAGVGQYSMLTAQIADRRRQIRRTIPPTVPVDPVVELIERLVRWMDRIEGRQVTNADAMSRMADGQAAVKSDLEASQARADQVSSGEPGEAADAGAQSGKVGKE